MGIKNKFSKIFKKGGKMKTVYFGDKRFNQVKNKNPKQKHLMIKQAKSLLRHYKGQKNMSEPLIDKDGFPTPKSLVATIWGFDEPVITRKNQREIVKYAENLLKKAREK